MKAVFLFVQLILFAVAGTKAKVLATTTPHDFIDQYQKQKLQLQPTPSEHQLYEDRNESTKYDTTGQETVDPVEIMRFRKAIYDGGVGNFGGAGGSLFGRGAGRPFFGGAGIGRGLPYIGSLPAPPCPKNYLISCQPHLRPAPCVPSASSYQNPYSAQMPMYPYQIQSPLYYGESL